MSEPASCPRCGTATTAERFCPNCGLELQVRSGDTVVDPAPPDETGVVPVTVVRAQPGFVRALSSLARIVRESSVGRETARAADLALAGADVARAALKARSRAERELLGHRRALREAFQRREQAIRGLGEAVYRRDEAATETLKAEIAKVDNSIEERRRAMEAIVQQADAEVRQTQLEVQPTQIHAPEHPDVPEPYPPPGETDPPQQPDIPEPYPPPGELDPPVPPDVPEPYPPSEPETQ